MLLTLYDVSYCINIVSYSYISTYIGYNDVIWRFQITNDIDIKYKYSNIESKFITNFLLLIIQGLGFEDP